MENCKTCVVIIQYSFFTPYEIVEGGFETTCIRKFTVCEERMEIIRNLFECYGATYNSEEDAFELSSQESYEAMTEYISMYSTL